MKISKNVAFIGLLIFIFLNLNGCGHTSNKKDPKVKVGNKDQFLSKNILMEIYFLILLSVFSLITIKKIINSSLIEIVSRLHKPLIDLLLNN